MKPELPSIGANRAILLILVPFVLAGASQRVVDLSSPEKTIAAYYLGYRFGDRSAIAQAFLNLNPSQVETTGLGADIDYRIEKKLAVLYSRLFGEKGDIEIVTYATWRTAQGTDELRTSFLLRKVNGSWKIVSYDSVGPKGCSSD